ncbi:MAG: BMP family ABC transporter substrate-binding protein [Chloroflexi bacterium RBG_16_54_11]|nr:MAG: BMP family ABC transporter substrate-binding protein [Chloroflexi bacterium RBG_16_54_11]
MYKKISLKLVVLLMITLLLVACKAAAPTEADCAKPEELCVGLVTSINGVADKSFNQSAWEGIQQAQTDLGAMVNYIETKDVKDYATNIRIFIDKKYDLIVTVGDALGEATNAAATANPDVKFIGVDQFQGTILPNLVGLVFHEDQSGFLAGALAAQMSKTGIIAGVFGTDIIPAFVAFKEGYEAGTKYINPNINIISTYYPSGLEPTSTDPGWGASITTQAIQNGADVVFDAGGKTGNGALIETARHPGLYCIGVDTDQWETVPAARPCLISSVVKLITAGVFDLIKMAKEGTFPNGNYFGASGLAPYHDFDSVIPQAVKDKIGLISSGLNAGSITTGYNPGK